MKMRVIFAEMNTSWVVMKLKLKKNHVCTGVEPMTSAVTVQCSTNWANKPTESWSFCWFAKNPWSDKRTSVIIYEYCLFELPHYWQWLGLMTFLVIPSGNSIIQWQSHTNVTKYGTSTLQAISLHGTVSFVLSTCIIQRKCKITVTMTNIALHKSFLCKFLLSDH